MEGKYQPILMGKKDFEEKGVTSGLMVGMKKPLWGAGEVLIMYRSFCVLEVLISMVDKGLFGVCVN